MARYFSFFTGIFILGLFLFFPVSSDAQTPQEVIVKSGRSVTVSLPRVLQRLNSENTDIAVVTILPEGKARVTGVSPGTTRLVGRDHAQVPIIINVRVLPE